jgi:chorismate synthase
MFGCHFGKLFQVTVAGGSYQEGLCAVVQGVPAGMSLTDQESPAPTSSPRRARSPTSR